MTEFKIYFDGACEPKNPGGYMGYGYVVKESGKNIFTNSYYEPQQPQNTNNVAEYKACLNALKELKTYIDDDGIQKFGITVYGDSKLVIEQMNRKWSIKGGAYAPFAFETKDFVKDHFSRRINFEWIPRELNSEADALSVRELKNIGINRYK